MFLVTALGSVLAVSLMLRLMDVAGHAETLGAAMNHASLNVANALGAWLGGLAIAAGYGYRSPLLVGLVLSFAGFAVLAVAFAVDRSQLAPDAAPSGDGRLHQLRRPSSPPRGSTS